MASENGHLAIVQHLLETHKRPDQILIDAALASAAEEGHLELVRFFLERHGANIHEFEEIALRMAALNGHLPIVRYLLERDGEKADIHGNAGREALENAIAQHRQNVVDYLLSRLQ
jgi:ankyrin repeat protein